MNNELFMLKVRENVVESCELWSGQECKVSKLCVSNEEAEKEFMLEDELLQPFVMTLRSEHSDWLYGCEVSEKYKKSSSWFT